MTAVGIFGFGRIGRNLFRLLYGREDIRIGAVADLAEPAGVEYLLRFDTLLGRFPDEVSARDGFLYVAGRRIPLLSGKKQPPVPTGASSAWTPSSRPPRAAARASRWRRISPPARGA